MAAHVEHLAHEGFSDRWVELQRDLWILVFATHPDTALALFRDQAETHRDPTLRRLFLDYDGAYGLDPHDPRVDALAGRIVEATRDRYGAADLPGQDADEDIPALVQGAVNDASPAWRRIDALVREQLGA